MKSPQRGVLTYGNYFKSVGVTLYFYSNIRNCLVYDVSKVFQMYIYIIKYICKHCTVDVKNGGFKNTYMILHDCSQIPIGYECQRGTSLNCQESETRFHT